MDSSQNQTPFDELRTLVRKLEDRSVLGGESGSEKDDSPAELVAQINAWIELAEQRRERSEFIIASIWDAFVSMDADGRIVEWNRQAERIFGWPREDAIGRGVAETIIPTQQRDDHSAGLQRFLATGEGSVLNQRIEVTAVRRDGSEFPAELTVLEPQEIGESFVFNAFVRDITRRKQAVDAIQGSEAMYHSLVDHLPINVTRKDLDGRITFVNQPFCELVGMTADELVGKTDYDLSPPAFAEKYQRDDRRVATTGEVFHAIEENRGDDRVSIFEVWKVPIPDATGKIIETQAVFWDVTQRERAQEELRAARHAADAANRAKGDFLANMSHEIRTPMNAIIGMTQLTLETELTATQREYLTTVCESGDTLLSLINDILDFSKIEAGKLDLDSVLFGLREHVGNTLKLLAVRAHDAGLELTWRIDRDVSDALIGDPHRLRQVLVNLIGNAIKFTEQGEVVLDVSSRSCDSETAVLNFAVRDTGVGIADDKQASIFGAFEQADTTSTRRFSGTGLGLAISSRLVELMNGEISVESQVGQGSTFSFTTQFAIGGENADEDRRRDTSLVRGIRVLVVDDNATNRRILDEILRNWNMQPTTVAGASEALDSLRQAHDTSEPFPLVLSDVNMPDIDGLTLMKQIREDANLSGTAVILLTSSDRPTDEIHRDEFAIRACLMKPVKQSELFDAVVSALGVGTMATTSIESTTRDEPLDLPPLKILLAEDSVANQKLAVALLEKRGHSVIVVNNGREAVAVLASGTQFDVVLMDVQMPEMDGFEATRLIRQRERETQAHIPIIAMTAHAMSGDRERCLEAGMDEYVSKPFRIGELMAQLAQCSTSRKNSGGGFSENSDSRTLTSLATPETSGAGSESAGLDWAAALETTDGDRELLKVLVESMLDESPRLLNELADAIANADSRTVQRAAHTIAGLVRIFDENELAIKSQRLEELGRTEKLTGASDLLQSVNDRMAAIMKELTAFLSDEERR